MGNRCEFHFQEGFTGQTVTVTVEGRAPMRFEVHTRLQTGLARIEKLELNPGQTVTIAMPDLLLRHDYRVGEDDRWITINLVGRALVVRPEQRSPGYL